MALSAKFWISAIASIAAVSTAGGVIYTLDKNSLSEEETLKLTKNDNKLVERKVCSELEVKQIEKWGEICKNVGELNPKRGGEEYIRPTSFDKDLKGYDLSQPDSNLHFQNLGENVLGDLQSQLKSQKI